MSSVLVQFRTEDKAKAMATRICDRLGLDLQSYLRMCISRMNQENGIPFSMNVNDIPKNRGLEAMKEARRIARENGISDMTLDEINTEIDAVRRQVTD